MDVLTRDVDDSTYRAAGAGNPPPLHVQDVTTGQANWYPYERPYIHPSDPGPMIVQIPTLPADEFGEDPTDPSRCHQPRIPTGGLVARLDLHAGGTPNVGPGGVRR